MCQAIALSLIVVLLVTVPARAQSPALPEPERAFEALKQAIRSQSVDDWLALAERLDAGQPDVMLGVFGWHVGVEFALRPPHPRPRTSSIPGPVDADHIAIFMIARPAILQAYSDLRTGVADRSAGDLHEFEDFRGNFPPPNKFYYFRVFQGKGGPWKCVDGNYPWVADWFAPNIPGAPELPAITWCPVGNPGMWFRVQTLYQLWMLMAEGLGLGPGILTWPRDGGPPGDPVPEDVSEAIKDPRFDKALRAPLAHAVEKSLTLPDLYGPLITLLIWMMLTPFIIDLIQKLLDTTETTRPKADGFCDGSGQGSQIQKQGVRVVTAYSVKTLGVDTYDVQKAKTELWQSLVEAHHIVPSRFALQFQIAPGKMPAAILPWDVHFCLDQAINQELPGVSWTKQQIRAGILKV